MFEGYSDKTVDLFWGIRFNNDREWFAGHKQDFNRFVMQPTKELANTLLDWFTEQYPKLNLNVHISRVYRDARRLFGRGPLNDHIWFSFQSAVEKRDEAPCFWFEVGCEGYKYGVGYWMKAADAARYRRIIDADPDDFKKRIKAIEKQDAFVQNGAQYAKPKGHAEDALCSWYNIRSADVSCACSYDAVSYSPELVKALQEGYSLLMPYFEILEKTYLMAD